MKNVIIKIALKFTTEILCLEKDIVRIMITLRDVRLHQTVNLINLQSSGNRLLRKCRLEVNRTPGSQLPLRESSINYNKNPSTLFQCKSNISTKCKTNPSTQCPHNCGATPVQGIKTKLRYYSTKALD